MSGLIKNTIKFIIYAIPVVTLFVFDNLLFPFITSKAFLFRLMVEVALALSAVLVILEPEYRPKKSKLLWSVGIFTIIIFIANIFSVNETKAFWSNFERMEGFITILHLFVYFIIAGTVLKKREDWNNFFFVSTGVSFFLIAFGMFQLFGEGIVNKAGARLDGTLGNPAYFAIYLVFQIVIFALLWWRNGSKIKGIAEAFIAGSVCSIFYYIYLVDKAGENLGRNSLIIIVSYLVTMLLIAWARLFSSNEKIKIYFSRVIYFVGLVLNVVLLYLTATRSAILGLMGGIVLFSLFALYQKENQRLRKIGGVFLTISILVIGLFFATKNTAFVQNSPILSRFASISLSGAKGQARELVWPMAIEGVKERPILGWGQEGFLQVFSKYYDPRMWGQEPWFDRAHNSFLDFLIAGGILGLLSYLSIFGAALYFIFKARHIDSFERAILLGLFGAYAFNNMFIFDNLISYIFFFSFLAMIHSESADSPNVKISPQHGEGKEALVFLVVVISVVPIYFFSIKPIIQNTTLVDALNIMGVNKNGEVISCTEIQRKKDEAGKYTNTCTVVKPTLDLFTKAISYSPVGRAESLEQFVSTSISLNRDASVPVSSKEKIAKSVLAEYQKYVDEFPSDTRGLLVYSMYLRSLGLTDKAIEYLERAKTLSPKKQQILISLAEMYIEKKENTKALENIKSAYEEDTNYIEAKIYYALVLLSIGEKVQFKTLVDELAYNGTADKRIVDALNTVYGKVFVQEYLNRVLIKDPKNETALNLLKQYK